MAEARRINTLALSELPDEDCCSLLLPRQVETRARVADLHRIEARLDVDELAESWPLGPGIPAWLTANQF
jgi:thiamine biosynthesis protein ThiI